MTTYSIALELGWWIVRDAAGSEVARFVRLRDVEDWLDRTENGDARVCEVLENKNTGG